MTLEPTSTGTLLIITVMALVTLITRYGGVFLMSWVPINRRVEGFINGLSGSVLVALVLPLAVAGDLAARLALLATLGVYLLWGRPLPAISAGMGMAAAWRYFF